MRRVFLACLAWIVAVPVLHADGWPVPRGPSREPVPHQYDPAVIKRLPRDFLEDSIATVLHAGSTYLVEADGTVETIIHEITRLNGRKGVEKLGEFRGILYTPAYQKLTLNQARIHKASGRIVEVEPRHVHLRDVGTDFQVYDQEKQLVISFPGLEVGDTTEVRWSVRGKNPEHGGQFFTRYAFGDLTYPVVSDELTIGVPSSMPLTHRTINGTLEPRVSQEGDQRLYRWRKNLLPRLPRDEQLPSREELRTTVAVSTFGSWADVGKWKQKLRSHCWKCTPGLAEIVREVCAGATTPTEKARALTYWVRRKVRYVSAGDRHDFTPHTPEQVVANRFGDCKDTSQLLAVLLREAGLSVELATLGARDDGQIHPEVPSPWGTHAILLVTVAGKEHWIDTTTSLAGWDFLPRDDLDRLCYLTDEAGKLRLKRTPAPTPAGNRLEQTTNVHIGNDGTTRCRRDILAFGSAALAQRDSYSEVPVGEARRQMTAELQDSNSRARLLRLDVNEKSLANHDLPVQINVEFEIPQHFTGTSDREGSFTDSRVWGKLLAYNVDLDRKMPMVLPGPFESIHTWRFHLPVIYGLDSLPRAKKVTSPWGSFTVTSRALDDGDTIRHVEVVFRTVLDRTRIEVSELEAFRKFHEAVNRDYRVWLTLRPVSEIASAGILEEALKLAPDNALTAATLARLYIRGERLPDARRVLDRACYYNPESVELRTLRIEAADSFADEEQAQRALIALEPDNLDHGRTLASVLISRGKHDEANKLLESLLKKGTASQKALAHYQLARSCYRKDALTTALDHLDQAAKLDAESVNLVRVHVLRGQLLDELKQPARALEAYRKAFALEGKDQEVLVAMIRLSLMVKDRAGAIDLLRRYALLVENDTSGLALAGESYFQLNRLEEALDLALRARELGFNARIQRLLGMIYLQREDYARAILHLDRADPDPAVVTGQIRAAIHLGQLSDADRILDRADKLTSPPREWVDRYRAILSRRDLLMKQARAPGVSQETLREVTGHLACAEELIRRPGGEAAAEKLLARLPDRKVPLAPVHVVRGTLHLRRGRLTRALQEASAALAINPDEPGGLYLRGAIRHERGQAGALDDLQRAATATRRKQVEILAALAECQASAGQPREALQTAREVLALQPEDQEHVATIKDLIDRLSRSKG